ncbi:MAG: 1-acyl-sn-glycerol-3-phosphate acyltransferase [Marivirga sp.]|jgi:1-acyl-sn-glycerol-3-phosphate acyltransferase
MKYFWREFIYRIIKFVLSFGFAFTYRNIITSGYNKVRKNKPALFVANHQNTFMDGVLMVFTAGNSNPNILVRADIFKSSLAKKALGIIKLMPIYRKRDGVNTASQNEQIFNQCFEIFNRKGVVGLFPEGNHGFPRMLRPLQKGASRIAFQAEEEHNFNLNLSIIPVGLQYEHQTNKWHDVHVHYTEAINIQQYKTDFEDNPQTTYKTVTDKIQSGISSQMIDIAWEAEIDFFEELRILMKDDSFKQISSSELSMVHHENRMINVLTTYFKVKETEKDVLKQRLSNLIKSLKEKGIDTYYSLKKRNILFLSGKIFLLTMFSPFLLASKLLTAIPELAIEKGVIAKVKDITWHLSLRFAISSFLYPVYFGIIWLVLALCIDNIFAAIIIFSLPIISIIGLEWIHRYKELKNEWILFTNKDLLKDKTELAKEISTLML